MRLQKFLAERGVASRRACAELVEAGRVTVNGVVVTEPGLRIDPANDEVWFDGSLVGPVRESLRTIMLNKPRGFICSTSEKDGRTVYELLEGITERLVPVGRLDMNSEGLLLLSNDGNLINRLTHPKFEHEKAYQVTVGGTVDESVLEKLRASIVIEGYQIRAPVVRFLRLSAKPGMTVLEFVLKEGRKRQIRVICETAGLEVYRLFRTRIGTLKLGTLKPGFWRDLTPAELRAISG